MNSRESRKKMEDDGIGSGNPKEQMKGAKKA